MKYPKCNKAYHVRDGVYYDTRTAKEVIEVLAAARRNRTRIRVHYGDVQTGRDWMEECDVMGRVENSTGPIKIPILVHNSRSLGGGAILDHCIVKITTARKKTRLYQHPQYHITEQ